jgi:hypothetical protein
MVTCALALIVPTLSGAPSAAAPQPQPQPLGELPTIPPGATRLGALDGSTVLHMTLALRPRSPKALTALAQSIATPQSPEFRQYRSVAQFASQLGPSAADLAEVKAALEAIGLRHGSLSPNHLALTISASSATIGHAFGLSFDRYRLADGRVAYANTAAPKLTPGAAPHVQAVLGLDDLNLAQRLAAPMGSPIPDHLAAMPRILTGGPQPCATASATASATGAYTADQLASAYQFSTIYGRSNLGGGQTVAIYELEPNLTSDISAYQACYGTNTTVAYLPVDGGSGSGAGSGEAALDIEDVLGLAPSASIDIYQGPNGGSGPYDTFNAIMAGGTAQVVSTSWGLCEASLGSPEANAENTLFQEAAVQGQSVVAAAGDRGSEACAQSSSLAVSDPASQPFVTGVGGTSLSALGPPPAETVWNDNFPGENGAGGGGISALWPMPSYQAQAPASLNVVNANSSGSPCRVGAGQYCREVPDVAADADPATGYVIYYNGQWVAIGGTSAAAPLWAAFLADVNASPSCRATATDVGFVNPLLYQVGASPSAFHDVATGDNDLTQSNGGKFPAGSRYDMASGLGTPDGATLANYLCPLAGYGIDGAAHSITGGGSAMTWQLMSNLSTEYGVAPGCPDTPPSVLPANADLDTCTLPLPRTNSLGNFDHDTVSQAAATGSAAGISTLNQDQGGSVDGDCYSGGAIVQRLADPTPCASSTNARFVSDGVTTDASATVTSATAHFTAADIGKAIQGETNIPSGETIVSIPNSTTAVMSSPANGSATSVLLEIGAFGPTVDVVRSGVPPKTTGGSCTGGDERACDTFWGFAEDGIQIDEFNDSSCLGNLTFSDLLSIWNGTTKTWGALASLDSGSNALCVGGRSASDPIIPWGMNPVSDDYGVFQTLLAASGAVPSAAGTDQALHDSTGDFPLGDDVKPLVNDVANFGIPHPVSGNACASGLSATLSSPCDPDNWVWWSSYGLFSVNPSTSSVTIAGATVSAFPGEVNGKVPSKSNVFAGTYSMVHSLFHVTKAADATCPVMSGSCDFLDNPGPAIGAGTTLCQNGPGGTCDLNVVGAPGNNGISGAVREFTRWLCRSGASQQSVDPFTGLNFDAVITSDISASGFTKVPTTLVSRGSRCFVVPG